MMNVSGWVGKFHDSDSEPQITATAGEHRRFDGSLVPYVMLSINAGGCVHLFLTREIAHEIACQLSVASLGPAAEPEVIA